MSLRRQLEGSPAALLKHPSDGFGADKASTMSRCPVACTVHSVHCCPEVQSAPRPAGVFARTWPVGGGGEGADSALSLVLTREPAAEARRARRPSKSLNEYLLLS